MRLRSSRRRAAFVFVGSLVASIMMTGTATATSVVGPSWVPTGATGCWSVDGWDYPADVDWGDGRSTASTPQPFCHGYRKNGTYRIEVSRYDIDAGTVILGSTTVSTAQPTMAGPFVPGTETPTSPIAGDTVEFRFSIPGAYATMWHAVNGSWQSAASTTLSVSFGTAGDHTVGIKLASNGWSDDYSRTWPLSVGVASTTTTTEPPPTTTTVAQTTTTTTGAPATTTSVASSAARDDLDEEEEPIQTAVPRGALTVSPSEEEPEEELPMTDPDPEAIGFPNPDQGGARGISILGIAVLAAGGALVASGAVGLRVGRKPSGGRAGDMAIPSQPNFPRWLLVAVIGTGLVVAGWGGFAAVSGASAENASSGGGYDVEPGFGSVEDPGDGEFADPALGFGDNYCDSQTDLPYNECAVLAAQRQSIGNVPDAYLWDMATGPCNWSSGRNGQRGVQCDGGHVVRLNLTGMNVSGLSPLLALLPNLSYLECRDCSLGPDFPGFLNDMPALEVLILPGNGFTGPLPSGIVHPGVTVLDLSNNELVGGLPGRWATNGRDLEFLLLGDNNLDGSVTAISGMASLVNLNLSNNQFTGNLPTLNGGHQNTSLIRIDLSHNRFSGPLWDMEITARAVDLSDNNLSGGIPGGLFKHRVSIAYEPDFVSELVDFFGGSDAISYPDPLGVRNARIDLSNNELGGLIPGSVAGFHGSVDVSGNRLWGPIPRVDWLETDISYIVNGDAERVYRNNDCLSADGTDHSQVLYKMDPFWNNGC